MFESTDLPRVFAVPPGVDLPRALIKGLERRLAGASPEAWARVEIFVNTRRMQRRIISLFTDGPARLLPRIRTITDLGRDADMADLPAAVPPLRRRLELTQLIARLLEQEPDIAPRSALFALADSLAGLMDEMQGEGVPPAALRALDVGNLSGHWQRSLRFLNIIEQYFGAQSTEHPDSEARQRLVIERLISNWADNPPEHPVIVAGSTGSRGATAQFMRAVARLPQGALVLPGFDTVLPAEVWDRLSDPMTGEDHPQFRFSRLLRSLSLSPADTPLWLADKSPPNPARNALLSLALRPAPVTDQWLKEGKKISREDILNATESLTLIEAPSPRAEAVAIALRLRKAVEDGQQVALITPNRTLARQVTAALDRWNIEPDDSAGRPLALSAPGRFLRHVSALFGQKLTAANLLSLLKHPLCSSAESRGNHLRWTRDLELEVLRKGLPFPTGADMVNWAATDHAKDFPRLVWAKWLAKLLAGLSDTPHRNLSDHLENHLRLAQDLAAGPDPDKSRSTGELWEKAAGREAWRIVSELQREASYGGRLSPADYADLFRSILNNGEVRDLNSPHPDVMIWGTLEARVQGADLVILAGLNDGIWPEMPSPDPWLNRQMRHEAGLLLPDRRIGLSAHDFQQAFAAREVVLSRAIRDAESETVASRWLLRLTNLLSGLPAGGEEVITSMRRRGDAYLRLSVLLDQRPEGPLAPIKRPSPRPPIETRPKRLSVTRISRLVRDPYSIYAESILGLRALDSLQHMPDAPLRGTIMHQIMEQFFTHTVPADPTEARILLLKITDSVLEKQVPWLAARILWRAKLERITDQFLAEEKGRQHEGGIIAHEIRGKLRLEALNFTLSATADRIDRLNNGTLAIYDYKSGTLPTPQAQVLFDKQLVLEAVIASAGGFEGITKGSVAQVAYIALGSAQKFSPTPLDNIQVTKTQAELSALIGAYQSRGQGYTALRLDPKLGYPGDFDHLSRLGEWDISQMPEPEDVG